MNFKLGATEDQQAMEELIEPTHTQHTRPVDKINNVFEITICKNNYRKHKESAKYWEANKTHTFTLVLVHCTPKIEGSLKEMMTIT